MIDIEKFTAFLRKTNKSANTVASYCFAARQYTTHFGEFTKKNLLLYKTFLIERFKPKTVNIRLLAMNAYATCIGKPTLKMPLIRIQQKPFLENVISDADYAYFKRKLNNPAERYWYFVIRFLAATGARIAPACATVSGISFGPWHAPERNTPAVGLSTGRSFGCASVKKSLVSIEAVSIVASGLALLSGSMAAASTTRSASILIFSLLIRSLP